MLHVVIISDTAQISISINDSLSTYSKFFSEVKSKFKLKGNEDDYILKLISEEETILNESNYIRIINNKYDDQLIIALSKKEIIKSNQIYSGKKENKQKESLSNEGLPEKNANSFNIYNENQHSNINDINYLSKDDREEKLSKKDNNFNININDQNDFSLFNSEEENPNAESNENIYIDMTPIEYRDNTNGREVTHFYRFTIETCSICSCRLLTVKLICCICENCTLCELCEKNHNHPCFLYKSFFLSNLRETFFYLQSKQELKNLSLNGRIFSKDLDITIEPEIDSEISIRPHQATIVPFKVKNLSRDMIDKDDIFIYAKNFKNVNVSQGKNGFRENIKGKEEKTMSLIIESGNVLCREVIIIELYSPNKKIKEGKMRNCKLIVEVNQDTDEDEINAYIKSEKAILLRKKYKEILVNLRDQGIAKGDFDSLCYEMKKYNWDVSKMINK